MRATRGLWAAVGAGTSLAAAGLLALFSVSVVLAIRGWPQVSKADGAGSVALRAQVATPRANGAAAAAPSPVVLPARSASAPRSHGRGAAQHGGHTPARRPSGTSSAPAGSTTAPSSPAGPSAQGGSGTGGSGSTSPIAQVPHTVSTTVTDVTDAAGGALQPVSPAVAQTVTATGQQAGDAIDQVGKTVDGVVGGLTGGGN
jgi:hypothetical protein